MLFLRSKRIYAPPRHDPYRTQGLVLGRGLGLHASSMINGSSSTHVDQSSFDSSTDKLGSVFTKIPQDKSTSVNRMHRSVVECSNYEEEEEEEEGKPFLEHMLVNCINNHKFY